MNFTKDQLKAIKERNNNILVSAAAGSGKTTILVERIIDRVINDKINIDKLLVVTFTNYAAEEMKERILNRINEELLKNPENIFLKEQVTRINKAQISTIDSFCLKIVKTNFKSLNIDPHFRIADTEEYYIMMLETLDKFLEKYYEKNDEHFINVLEAFNKKHHDKSFIDIFLRVYNESQNNPYPNIWLKNAYKEFNIKNKDDFFKSNTFLKIIEYSKSYLNEALEIFESIKLISKDYTNFDGLIIDGSLEKFLYDEFYKYNLLLKYIEKKDYKNFLDLVDNLEYSRWSSKFLKDHPNIREEVKNLRDISKKIVKSINEKFFNKTIDEIINNNNQIFPIIKNFCELIIEFDKYFMEVKKDKKLFTFNDISHFCLDILLKDGKPSKIAKEYEKFFIEIIVDEYQDSNYIQEEILSSISSGKNKFMVGDIKQCIYKFRQANPNIFNEKYNGYFSGNLSGIRIDLNTNFRSNKSVIDSINFIFDKIMCSDLGNVEYNNHSKLYYNANFPHPKENDNILKNCEFCIIDCSKENDDQISDETLELKSIEIEAHFVAKKIISMIEENTLVFDKNIGYRPVTYKDIVILMRSNSFIEIFSNILSEYNIPVLSKSNSNFFDFTEIKTIINILKIIDNPFQDLPLIGTMYSPIFNFLPNELLEIKLFSKNNLFYNNILKFIEESKNTSLVKKSKNFILCLEKWQRLSRSLSINELLSYIYSDSNYYNYIGVLKDGKVRQDNLFKFLEKSISFENTNLHGIFGFISYIEKIKTFSQDIGTSVNSENENLVRIMTIHKSKGLEFPIVFISNLNKKFNEIDYKNSIIFDEQYMLGVSIFKPISNEVSSTRKIIDSIQKELIKTKSKEEAYSEELRILYVALTRAKEKLILTGCISKNFQETLKKLENLIINNNINNHKKFLPKYFINESNSNNYLAWIYSVIKNYDKDNLWKLYKEDISSIMKNEKNLNTNNIDKLSNIKNYTFKNLITLDCKKDYSNNKQYINFSLNWKYPNLIDQNINSTSSISEIKRAFQTKFLSSEKNTLNLFNKTTFQLPTFYNSKSTNKLTPMQKGSIYHKIFENLDLRTSTINDIHTLINSLINKNIISEEESKVINISKILKFLNSDLAERIRKSKNVQREIAFRIGLYPKEIYSDEYFKNSKSLILVNGIIDLYFEENDKIILVDYKTDKILDKEYLKDRYKLQLDIYKKALERATDKNVSECILYLIFNEKTLII